MIALLIIGLLIITLLAITLLLTVGVLITVGVLVAYLVIGFLVARSQLEVAWERVRKGTYYLSRDEHQRQVRHRMIVNALAWPYVLPTSLITSALNEVVDRRDPEMMAEQLAERERELAESYRRISQLERELGIQSDHPLEPPPAAGR
jgi:hypothetical protein